MYDVLIIGAGVVGSILARELTRYKLNIAFLDRENDVGNVTSMANSAIIHSGYDPLPNSLKARMNVLGNPKFDLLAKELDFHFYRIGSITVALYDNQIKMLEDLALRAKENGVEVKLLNKEELLKLEPNLNKDVKMGLLAPTAGIIDPFNFVVHAAENAVDNGAKLFLDTEVTSIDVKDNYYLIHTNKGDFESKMVINSAGLGSVDIARMVDEFDYEIKPRKGEYFILDHFQYGFVNHTIFPLPSEKGKGILVSPTSSFNYMVGPSSEEVSDFSDFSTDKLTLNNVKEAALELVPNIPFNQVIRTYSGLRSTCTKHDFIIEPSKNHDTFINLVGIESPGFVSSPAIAEYVINQFVSKHFSLRKNDKFNPYVKKYHEYYNSDPIEWDKLVKENPDYGVMVCNCEKITLGQIRDCLSRSVPPHTIKAMKKRCRAGMGKCQGGFCQSRVLNEIAKHFNIEKTEVLYDKNESYVLKEKIKVNK